MKKQYFVIIFIIVPMFLFGQKVKNSGFSKSQISINKAESLYSQQEK